MLLSEFVKRTGFEPTAEEYAEIEDQYYNFDGDKDAFCEHWKKTVGVEGICKARAEKIAQIRSTALETEKHLISEIAKRDKQIKELTAQLDAELEWKQCEAGTIMVQDRYNSLAKTGKALTDEEAKNIIYEEFGFAPDKVSIIRTVSTYEANKHGVMRIAETFDRDPVYDATDYNYIRFDCSCWCYEMVNGVLRNYYC